jgi:hypothetical protein
MRGGRRLHQGVESGRWRFAPTGGEMNELQKIYPIVLNYSSEDRKWSLTFQQRPENKIIFEGVTPTLEEIIQVLSNIHAPVWMIGVIQVCIEVAKAQRT